MIATDDFVILNLPKTGSTFVRNVVKEIFYRRNKNVLTKALHKLGVRRIGYREIMTDHPMKANYQDQHGCFDQIPVKHNNKPILSVVRDPYSRMESSYRFRWWAKHPFLEKDRLTELFPGFPDLTFKEFTKFYALESDEFKRKYKVDEGLKIGKQSIQFIRLFFKNHEAVFRSLNENYISEGLFKRDMCHITFIKNENLNEELAHFLSQYGFSQNELDFIRNHKKVNATKNDTSKSHLNQHLVDFVNEYEWVMLDILESLGINYRRE